MILPIYASLEKLDNSLLEAAEVLGARPAARLPPGHPAPLAPRRRGRLPAGVHPALGSFLTSDLLGGAKELMIGNLVQNQFASARELALRIGRVVHPDGARARRGDDLSARSATTAPGAERTDMRTGLPRWLIALVAAVYLFLHLPILVLVAFSFNASKFSVEWTGFSLEWYRRLLRAGRHSARRSGRA